MGNEWAEGGCWDDVFKRVNTFWLGSEVARNALLERALWPSERVHKQWLAKGFQPLLFAIFAVIRRTIATCADPWIPPRVHRSKKSSGVAHCHPAVDRLVIRHYPPGDRIRGLSVCQFRNGSRLVVTISRCNHRSRPS